jgi:hypothetical protein
MDVKHTHTHKKKEKKEKKKKRSLITTDSRDALTVKGREKASIFQFDKAFICFRLISIDKTIAFQLIQLAETNDLHF